MTSPTYQLRAEIKARLFTLLVGFCLPNLAQSAIHFEDVSEQAGIIQQTPTAASSWGDFNGDGWPDLWVSNHHGRSPNLFLNQRDGSFVDIAHRILDGELRADFHGAAWADFDNDGDQDLFVTTGGGAGRGHSPNFLFVNEKGRLTNRAETLGVDYPLGRGRLPVWLDADGDGRLDILVVNRFRKEAPSAIFTQTKNGFEIQKQYLDAQPLPRSNGAGLFDRVTRWLGFGPLESSGQVRVNEDFAQLADISGNGKLDLVAYFQPMRLYSIGSESANEFTKTISVPDVNSVQDIAIEDFNNDGQLDFFLARSRPWALDVVQTDATHLQGKIGNKANDSKSVKFRTTGKVNFAIYRPWMDPTDPARNNKPKLVLGSRTLTLSQPEISVTSSDAEVKDSTTQKSLGENTVAIIYDKKTNYWTFSSSVRQIGFVITSSTPIDSYETIGFKPSKGDATDFLLLGRNGSFISNPSGLTDFSTACASVVAGDFDNDMDVDLYLVCSGPTENFPNILYENDGNGNFSSVAKAGGAGGRSAGLGNQCVTADFDRDGFLDLFVTNGAGPPPFAAMGQHQLFRNTGNSNNWLEFDLQGVKSNRDGLGAKVVVKTGDKTQTRQQNGGMHSFSQNHSRIHFGMGSHESADEVTINWPSGAVQRMKNIKANQIVVIREQVQE